MSCFPFDDVAQTLELAEAVAAAGGAFVIDPNPRSGMMSDRAEFVRGFEQLVPHTALVKVGEDDAALLYGSDLDTLRVRLVDLGADAVLATYGAAGAAVEAGDIVVTKPVSDAPGRIVDTMGGGDAVLASVVSAYLHGAPVTIEDWDAVLQRAMDVAAATVRFEGALLRLPSSLDGTDMDRIGT